METITAVLVVLPSGSVRRGLHYGSNDRIEWVTPLDPDKDAEWTARWLEDASEDFRAWEEKSK